MIVIAKRIRIMKLGILIGDDPMIRGLIMIMLNLNMRRNLMVKKSATMNLMIIVGGTINLGMEKGTQILNMILITMTIMSIREDGGSMMKEMTMVIIINIPSMIRWKMIITLNDQNLNHVIGTEIVTRTMIIIVQRGPILGNMITRNLSKKYFSISLVRFMVSMFLYSIWLLLNLGVILAYIF
jgi:hypothetical protein